MAHRLVRQVDDGSSVRAPCRARRCRVGRPAARSLPRPCRCDRSGLERDHDRRPLRLPGRLARQPLPSEDEGSVSGHAAAQGAAHGRHRRRPRQTASPARALPLLQPRLHRHRRRDRADHRASSSSRRSRLTSSPHSESAPGASALLRCCGVTRAGCWRSAGSASSISAAAGRPIRSGPSPTIRRS